MTKVKSEEPVKDILHKVLSGKVEKPTAEEALHPKKLKKRGYALCLAYQGKNYFGMQVQPMDTQPTIESKLFEAMIKVGMISEEEKKKPFLFNFQRAARTDRKVSAVRQMISFNLGLPDEIVQNGPKLLNDNLPEDIRVLTIRRTIPSFHSQKRCDYRTYSYTLPTFAFAPVTELTTPSFRLSEERRAEVNDVLKCFVGTHNFYNYTSRRLVFLEDFVVDNTFFSDHSDMSSNRYIIDFTCSEPFLYTHDFGFRKTEFEFSTIYIKGQSFMMHQIRKMIGMTLTIVRGFQNKSDVTRSFESARMDVPRAPGLGLILEQVHYHSYDKTYSKIHPTLDTFGSEIEEEIKKIRKDLIIKEILETEAITNQMMIWLSDLIKHNFQVDAESDSGEHHGLAKAHAVALGENSIFDEDDDESQGPNPSDDAPIDEKVKEQAETEESEKVAAKAL